MTGKTRNHRLYPDLRLGPAWPCPGCSLSVAGVSSQTMSQSLQAVRRRRSTGFQLPRCLIQSRRQAAHRSNDIRWERGTAASKESQYLSSNSDEVEVFFIAWLQQLVQRLSKSQGYGSDSENCSRLRVVLPLAQYRVRRAHDTSPPRHSFPRTTVPWSSIREVKISDSQASATASKP